MAPQGEHRTKATASEAVARTKTKWHNEKRKRDIDMATGNPPSAKHALVPKNRIRRAIEESVIFSAGLTHPLLHLGQDQNIHFDHVEINKGNGYNPHHGTFVAPVAGTYVFHTSILSHVNREIMVSIVVNGHRKASAYARGTDGRHDQGSQLVIVHLQAGDDVAVQNTVPDDAIYSDQNMANYFSGFLLEHD